MKEIRGKNNSRFLGIFTIECNFGKEIRSLFSSCVYHLQKKIRFQHKNQANRLITTQFCTDGITVNEYIFQARDHRCDINLCTFKDGNGQPYGSKGINGEGGRKRISHQMHSIMPPFFSHMLLTVKRDKYIGVTWLTDQFSQQINTQITLKSRRHILVV